MDLNRKLALSEGKKLITIDKFDDDNLYLYKFKVEMVLAIKDLWKNIEGSYTPPSTMNDEVKQTYQWRCNKVFAIIHHEFGQQRIVAHKRV